MSTKQDLLDADTLWQYHCIGDNIELISNSLIIGLGSYDVRVAKHCAELSLSGVNNRIIFTGKSGNWTRDLWGDATSEARLFADIAIENGVLAENIILEEFATNIGENINFVKNVCISQEINIENILLVTKPNTTRRAYATFLAVWPEVKNKLLISSPNYNLSSHASLLTTHQIIAELVGDLERIVVYPEKGFQIQQDIPDSVLLAYQRLRENGYTEHCILNNKIN